MSDSGDEEGFHPHPGDPWHPEWSDESLTGEVADAGGKPPKKRRGLFRRKGKGAPPPESEAPQIAAAADRRDELPASARDAGRAEDSTPGVEDATPKPASGDAPLPAWLSEVPPAPPDLTLTVELPSWAGDTTTGAAAALAGFDDTAEPDEPSESGGMVELPPDVESALQALGTLEDVEVIPLEDEDQAPRGAAGLGEDDLDLLPEAAAPAGEYGVASREAFSALRDLGDDDLGEWEAFTGAEAIPAPGMAPRPVGASDEQPAPEAFDDGAGSPEPRRRGIWPFRRNRRAEGDLAEEPLWTGEGAPVPEGWFAQVDEDEVIPPPADLPETEWPEPVPGAAAPRSGGWDAPPASDGDRVPDGISITDHVADQPAAPPPTPSGVEPIPGAEEYPALGYGVEAMEPPSIDQAAYPSPDDRLFRPPAEDLVPPRGHPAPSDDEWVTGPIELGEAYDDATVELPAGYAADDERVYRASATMEHRGFAEELSRAEDDTEWQAISAAMPGVGTGVVGFDDVADLGDEEDVYEAPTRSELGTRALTGIVLVGFLVGSIWVGGAAAAAFIGLLVVLGLGEFYGTLRHTGYRPLALFGYLGGIAMLAATWFHGPIAIPVAIGLTAVLVFFVYAFAPVRRDALTNGGLTVLGLTWVVGGAAFVVPILRAERYRVLVMAVVAVTAAMDIGAYAVGRTWGRRALAPILSPNKSVEGLIGGIAACLAVAAAIGSLVEPFDLRSGLALGAVVCLVAPVGDLAESMVKRSLGVKDMGAVLPGHGGILDRVDAFLFVIPAAWVLLQIIGLLG